MRYPTLGLPAMPLACCAVFAICANAGLAQVGEAWQVNQTGETLNRVIYVASDFVDPDAPVAPADAMFVAVGNRQTVFVSADGFRWELRMHSIEEDAVQWFGVTHGNGRFLAVGSHGAFAHSDDGLHWERGALDTPFVANAVSYGAGAFVMVGESGTVYHSPNGIDWEQQATGVSEDLHSVTYGSGGFLAVGASGRVLTSPRGMAWTARRASTFDTLRDVVYADGRYLAIGDGGVAARSLDGVRWSHVEIVPSLQAVTAEVGLSDLSLSGVLHDGERFVAISSWIAFTSPDGVAWRSKRASDPDDRRYRSYNDVAFGNDLYVAVGDYGLTETRENAHELLGPPLRNFFSSLNDVIYAGGQFVMAGNGILARSADGAKWSTAAELGVQFAGLEHDGERYLAVARKKYSAGQFSQWFDVTGFVFSSPDGAGWSDGGPADVRNDVAYGAGRYVTVGPAGSIDVSLDGVAWAKATTPGGDILPGIDLSLVDLRGVVYGSNGFVAVGYWRSRGTILHSPDGWRWELVLQEPTEFALSDVAYGQGVYVAVGNGHILTSPDGVSWVERRNDLSHLYAVAFGAGRFYAVGEDGAIYSSSDAMEWIDQSISHELLDGYRDRGTGDFDARDLHGVTVAGGFALAVGSGGLRVSSGRPVVGTPAAPAARLDIKERQYAPEHSRVRDAAGRRFAGLTYSGEHFVGVGGGEILTSADGVRWEKVVSANESLPIEHFTHGLRDVAFGNGRFVAVGSWGECRYSENGRDWFRVSLDDFEVRAVTFGSGMFLLVGDAGRVYRSLDGVAWERIHTDVSNDLVGVAHGAGRFLVVGSDGLALSGTGTGEWTRRRTPTRETLHDVIWAGGRFVAAGEGGSLVYSGDGITWRTGNIEGVESDRSSRSRDYIHFRGFAHNGSRYVAVAALDSRASVGRLHSFYSSEDGENWIPRGAERGPGYADVLDVAYGNGRFVAVGTGGRHGHAAGTIYLSEDGVDWRVVTPFYGSSGIATDDGYSDWHGVPWSGADLIELVQADGRFVALLDVDPSPTRHKGLVATSLEGFVWRHARGEFGRSDHALAHDGRQFLAVGAGAGVSTDGVNWVGIASDQKWTRSKAVAIADGLYVAVGYEGAVEISRDAMKWERQASVTARTLHAIVNGAGLFVAVGDNGVVQYSSDGRSWHVTEPVTEVPLYDIAYGVGVYIAVGTDNTYLRSTNGKSWQRFRLPMEGVSQFVGFSQRLVDLKTVSFGDNGFVIGATGGNFWRSTDLGLRWTHEQLPSGRDIFAIVQSGETVYMAGQQGLFGDNRDLALFPDDIDGARPAAYVTLRIDPDETSLNVQWDASAAGPVDGAVTGFVAVAVPVGTGPAFSCTAGPMENQCTVAGLNAGEDYDVTLYVRSGSERKPVSQSARVTTRGVGPRWRGWKLLVGQEKMDDDT